MVIAVAPVGSTQGFDVEHCHSPVCGAGTMPAPVELRNLGEIRSCTWPPCSR
jgi:hypothetical protein